MADDLAHALPRAYPTYIFERKVHASMQYPSSLVLFFSLSQTTPLSFLGPESARRSRGTHARGEARSEESMAKDETELNQPSFNLFLALDKQQERPRNRVRQCLRPRPGHSKAGSDKSELTANLSAAHSLGRISIVNSSVNLESKLGRKVLRRRLRDLDRPHDRTTRTQASS